MRRTTFAAVSALLASTSMTLAGGLQEQAPTPPAMVTPAPAAPGFDGLYAGLAYGHVSGDLTERIALVGGGFTLVPRDIPSDQAPALVAGYNWQRGNLVYGAEAVAWSVGAPIVGPFELTRLTDVRGRVGYGAGNALFYGAVGWSWGTWENTASGFNVGVDGHSLGLGVEYNVTERLFVGLDYTARSMDGAGPAIEIDMDVNTLSLRGGFRF